MSNKHMLHVASLLYDKIKSIKNLTKKQFQQKYYRNGLKREFEGGTIWCSREILLC